MTFLFKSPLRALISMVPLSITIVFIYGLLGILGRDYDMPVAVLSALTLGLSIDFAIHFIQRSRVYFKELKDWHGVIEKMFREPSRAIARNSAVVAIGFLPLLIAPLVPYQTVGFFMAAIMFASTIATLFILPAIISMAPAVIYKEHEGHFFCYISDCVLFSLAVSLTAAFFIVNYTSLSIFKGLIWTVSIFLGLTCICKCALKNEKICKFLRLKRREQ